MKRFIFCHWEVYRFQETIQKISCKTPIALEQFLRDFPEVNSIVLHLDNDRAGRLATKTIQQNLTQYHVRDSPPKYGKDGNDDLKTRLGIEKYPHNSYPKRIQTRRFF